MRPLLLLLLSVGVDLAWPSTATAAQAHAYDQDLDQPLYVGDVVISRAQIRREVIYGAGRAVLEIQEDLFLIEEEHQRSFPGDSDRVLVTEVQLGRAVDEHEANFNRVFPTLVYAAEVSREFRSELLHRRAVRRDLLFDQVFLPIDQGQWPQASFDALREEAGAILIEDWSQSADRRTAELREQLAVWDGRDPRPSLRTENPLYLRNLRAMVRDHLLASGLSSTQDVRQRPEWVSRLVSPIDGRPSRMLETASLWETLQHSVSSEELLFARRFLATVEATKSRLAREGVLLPWAEALSRWERRNAAGTLLAFGAHREAELAYAQLYESYRASFPWRLKAAVGDGLPVELREYLPRANAQFGLGTVQVEFLPILAFDWDAFAWKRNGWGRARERANQLAARLRKFPEDWSELRQTHGEFWDPPPPLVGGGCWTSPSPLWYRMAGSKRSFGDCRKALGESDFTEFVAGEGVAESFFFDAAPGSISGPLRGSRGDYLVKLGERWPAVRPLDLTNERHVELLRDSFVRDSLREYARQALASATVRGRLDL